MFYTYSGNILAILEQMREPQLIALELEVVVERALLKVLHDYENVWPMVPGIAKDLNYVYML